MKTITFFNNKGGVGKTTTSVNIAGVLSVMMGKRVLFIDLDGQANGTLLIGVEEEEISTTIFDVLLNGVPITEAIGKSSVEGLDIVKGSKLIYRGSDRLAQIGENEFILRDSISDVYSEYDYVIIDCPSDINSVTRNALTACDVCIIPIMLDRLSLKGFSEVVAEIVDIVNNYNPTLANIFVLGNAFDQTSPDEKNILKQWSENAPYPLLPVIKKTKWAKKSQFLNCPVVAKYKNIPFSKNLFEVAEALINNIEI